MVLSLAAASCGSSEREDPAVLKARIELPAIAFVHQSVIARSCSPSAGSCHNGAEYPDLHTVGNLLEAIGAPCNADRTRDPSTLFDGCEREPDRLAVDDFGFQAAFVWFGGEEWSEESAHLIRRFVLDAPSPTASSSASARILREGETIAVLPGDVDLSLASPAGVIARVEELDGRLLAQIRDGDPNRDGIIGSRDPWRLITPGRPERSYLVGRITGTVPGSRMPLANQALTDPEYVAIICWIEGLASSDPLQPIDYDACRFARHLVHYQR
jgi:hypothetical protein